MEGTDLTFKPNWREDAGGYLEGVRECGSLATEKRERQRKRELEKSACQTQSIVEVFSAQCKRKKPNNTDSRPDSLSFLPRPKVYKKGDVKKGETQVELQTRSVKKLEEFLHRKTEQIKKFGHILVPQSNYYCRHQMVQSFFGCN